MDTTIARLMRADPDVIFELGARVEDWPRFLPHYRWVRVIRADRDDGRVVEMAARRPLLRANPRVGLPVRWTAIQRAYPRERRIEFDHIRGVTRGMSVAWTLEPVGDGVVRVQIRHVFEPRWPLVPATLIRLVIGEYFVNGIAARTLGRVRDLAEASARRAASA